MWMKRVKMRRATMSVIVQMEMPRILMVMKIRAERESVPCFEGTLECTDTPELV